MAALNLEALERSLTVLEEKLYAALNVAAPEALLVGLKEHADARAGAVSQPHGSGATAPGGSSSSCGSNCWCTTTCRG